MFTRHLHTARVRVGSRLYWRAMRKGYPPRLTLFFLRLSGMRAANVKTERTQALFADLVQRGFQPSLRDALTLSELSAKRPYRRDRETIDKIIGSGHYRRQGAGRALSRGPKGLTSVALREILLQLVSDSPQAGADKPSRRLQEVTMAITGFEEPGVPRPQALATPAHRPASGGFLSLLAHLGRAFVVPVLEYRAWRGGASSLAIVRNERVYWWLTLPTRPVRVEIVAGGDLIWSSDFLWEGPSFTATRLSQNRWLLTGSHLPTPGGMALLGHSPSVLSVDCVGPSLGGESARVEVAINPVAHNTPDGQGLAPAHQQRSGRAATPVFRKKWMAPALEHYTRADQLFEELFGVNLFGVGGTLLGAVREAGFISHDKDIDVAYLSSESDPHRVREEFVDRICALLEAGERLGFVSARNNLYRRRQVKWWNKDKTAYIDLFPAFFNENGHFCRPTFVCAPLTRDVFEPLVALPFAGAYMWSPAKPHNKIRGLSGANWRNPDPDWVKPRFPDSADYLMPLRFTSRDLDRIQERLPESGQQRMSEARAKKNL